MEHQQPAIRALAIVAKLIDALFDIIVQLDLELSNANHQIATLTEELNKTRTP